MQTNVLKKVLYFVVNNKFINLNKDYLGYNFLQDKLLCKFHKLTMEVSLPQIINTKRHTKTAC